MLSQGSEKITGTQIPLNVFSMGSEKFEIDHILT
jgi:hypothetical protein